MNEILNINLVNNLINNFCWFKCRFINEFRFFIDKNIYYEDMSILEIVLEYHGTEKNYSIKTHLKELGPYELKAGGSRIQLRSFKIDDIREYGWNELNYKVTDEDMNSGIQVYCKYIEIVSVELCE